jgi:hypothetical protein
MTENYFKPREPGEIDLVEEVRNCMKDSGLGMKMDLFNNNRFINEASDKCSAVQRYNLNRYFNLQMLMSDKDTTEERFCLIPNGLVSEWLTLFQQKVLPFLIENDLPKEI